MEPIQDFASLISRLRSLKERKRVVVVCPNDPHTEYVITRSLHEGFADFLLVADTPHLLNSEYIRMQYPDHVKVYGKGLSIRIIYCGPCLIRNMVSCRKGMC